MLPLSEVCEPMTSDGLMTVTCSHGTVLAAVHAKGVPVNVTGTTCGRKPPMVAPDLTMVNARFVGRATPLAVPPPKMGPGVSEALRLMRWT